MVKNLDTRIKLLRKHLNMTQQEFADSLSVKRGAIANYEVGRNEPTDSVIALICREFNVNEEWLRTGEGDMFRKRTKNQEILAFANEIMEDVDDSFKKRFVRALSKLNVSDWQTLEKIALELMKED